MTTTIEKLARAACESQGLDWDKQANFMTSAGGSDDEQEGFKDLARAVLIALLEPSEVMVRAAFKTGHFFNDERGMIVEAHTAMIQAALDEVPE